MNDESNPYVAPATTETTPQLTSSGRLRGVGTALLWAAVAAQVLFGRSMMLPMFAEFELQLPIFTLVAVSRWSFIGALLVAVSVLLVSMAAPEHPKARALLSFVFFMGLIVLAVFVLAMVVPIVSLFDSLS